MTLFCHFALKQSFCKFSESLVGQESSAISFLLPGQDLLYHQNKRLVCCLLYSHHGDIVWAHDGVSVIVSLQICHSVRQHGYKHNGPYLGNMADIWQKNPPWNNSNKDWNDEIRIHCHVKGQGCLCYSYTHVQVYSSGNMIASVWVSLSKTTQWAASEYL